MGIYDYAQSVLAAANDVWAAAGVGLPRLQYVAPGPFDTVSPDCDQVVVSVDSLSRGAPGQPEVGYVKLAEWTAVVTLAIWRGCMPTSEDESPPEAEDQNDAANVTYGDLDLMWRNWQTIYGAAGIHGCKHGATVAAHLLPVESAMGGARIAMAVDLLSD